MRRYVYILIPTQSGAMKEGTQPVHANTWETGRPDIASLLCYGKDYGRGGRGEVKRGGVGRGEER